MSRCLDRCLRLGRRLGLRCLRDSRRRRLPQGPAGAASTGSGAETSGAGATTVVVSLPSPGWARAGAIPPVSAVSEITMPDARTATTPRFEQNSRGAPTSIDSFSPKERHCGPQLCQGCHPRLMIAWNRSSRLLRSQKVHRWFDRGVTHRPRRGAMWNRVIRMTGADGGRVDLVACGSGGQTAVTSTDHFSATTTAAAAIPPAPRPQRNRGPRTGSTSTSGTASSISPKSTSVRYRSASSTARARTPARYSCAFRWR